VPSGTGSWLVHVAVGGLTDAAGNSNGAVLGNYRLRDTGSSENDGARVLGGTVTATLTYPDSSTHQATMTFDASQDAYVTTVPSGTGSWLVHVAVGGLTDAAGNSNGAAIDATATR
jgi:hypothetical protein